MSEREKERDARKYPDRRGGGRASPAATRPSQSHSRRSEKQSSPDRNAVPTARSSPKRGGRDSPRAANLVSPDARKVSQGGGTKEKERPVLAKITTTPMEEFLKSKDTEAGAHANSAVKLSQKTYARWESSHTGSAISQGLSRNSKILGVWFSLFRPSG